MNEKKLRLITEILAILVICLVSFVGVYTQKANKMENSVKEYALGKDLEGYRELVFRVSDATQVTDENGKVIGSTDDYSDEAIESNSYTKTENNINKEEDLTQENYKKSRAIIEERLKKLDVEDYNLSQDLSDGTIYLQIPENDDTDHTVSNILEMSNFKIADSKDDTNVLLSNKDIKNVSSVYNTTESGTIVYLQIEFNKEGKDKLKEISMGEYATKEEEENNDSDDENEDEDEEIDNEDEGIDNEDEESAEESEENSQKEVTLSIGNNSMVTTSFDEPIENGAITLSMNAATTDTDKINESMRSTSTIAMLINSGVMPITYKIQINRYVNTEISSETLKNVIYISIAIVAIAILFLVFKYKLRGLIAGIAYIGFLGLYLLVIRYTNVQLAISSIVGIVFVSILDYIVTINLLKIDAKEPEEKRNKYIEELKNTIFKLIPILLVAIVFTYTKWTAINIFGMFMFWGIILIIIYNFLLTRDMID